MSQLEPNVATNAVLEPVNFKGSTTSWIPQHAFKQKV